MLRRSKIPENTGRKQAQDGLSGAKPIAGLSTRQVRDGFRKRSTHPSAAAMREFQFRECTDLQPGVKLSMKPDPGFHPA
jgi:hypothetical protein